MTTVYDLWKEHYPDSKPEPWCPNCGDRLCMGCVFREYDHNCMDDCPMCCVDGKCVIDPVWLDS